ncbi:MAG: hypothetical protein EAX81_08125 [Candidatus Thorarchaeota archaeon]|nr:hypothetical protein [Candidatus Thorarchaeota archaeon]
MRYHATLAADVIDNDSLERIVDQVPVLNTIAIHDAIKYDYEVAMMASPLLELLIKAWIRFGYQQYLELARILYRAAAKA